MLLESNRISTWHLIGRDFFYVMSGLGNSTSGYEIQLAALIHNSESFLLALGCFVLREQSIVKRKKFLHLNKFCHFDETFVG
jgi:hypothetical protein